jgi:hypothetical protein
VRHTNDTSVDQTDCVCLMPEWLVLHRWLWRASDWLAWHFECVVRGQMGFNCPCPGFCWCTTSFMFDRNKGWCLRN